MSRGYYTLHVIGRIMTTLIRFLISRLYLIDYIESHTAPTLTIVSENLWRIFYGRTILYLHISYISIPD